MRDWGRERAMEEDEERLNEGGRKQCRVAAMDGGREGEDRRWWGSDGHRDIMRSLDHLPFH